MIPMANAIVAGVWLLLRRRGMVVQALQEKPGNLHWGADIWPLQWRVGVSWLAGYALVLMHVPLLFRTQGAQVAGQMGVTMTIANTLSLLALSWMTARIPIMARAVSIKDWVSLDHSYWRAFRVSSLAFAAGTMLFMLARAAIEWTPYHDRFLSIFETAGLVVAMGFYHVSGLFAAYLRVHLREPFLWPSLIGSTLTAALAIWVAPRWGSSGIIVVLIAVNSLFFFPITVWLWVHLRKKWHADEAL
jgi:O-antigen/teichoic acid export membrane protein